MTMAVCAISLTVAAAAQIPDAALRGSWAATAGGQTLSGTWTARALPDNANAAQGTWALLDGTRIASSGTWSAAKAATGWTGSWQARVAGSNQLLSGTWRVDAPAGDVKTFAALLQKSVEQQVSGAWASGPRRGAWSIRALNR